MTISSYRLPIILSLIFVLLFTSVCYAQFTIKYEKSIPWETISASKDGIAVNENGYVYIVGAGGNYVDYCTLLKIDQDGQIAWQRDFDKPIPSGSSLNLYIDVDYDDNVFIVSSCIQKIDDTSCTLGERAEIARLAIIKYDPEGNLLWRTEIDQDIAYGAGLGHQMVTIDNNSFIYILSDYYGSYCNSDEDTRNTEVYGVSSSGIHTFTEPIVLTQLRGIRGMDSSAVAIGDVVRTVHCVDPLYPEDEWDNLENKAVMLEFTPAGLATTLVGPLSMHSCDIDICGTNTDPPARCKTNAQRLAIGGTSNNITVGMRVFNSAHNQGYYGDDYYYLGTYTPEGLLVDIFEFVEMANLIETDSQGDLVILYQDSDHKNFTMKCSPYGDTLWNTMSPNNVSSHIMILDSQDSIYQFSLRNITLLNQDGDLEWHCPVFPHSGVDYLETMKLDDSGKIYLFRGNGGPNNDHSLVVYDTKKKLVILDGSEDNDPIADTKFWLIRMQNDIPNLTEDTLGQFTTDENGKFELSIVDCGQFEFVHDLYNGSTSDIISVGDSLKIAMHVFTEPAVKHTDSLGTMYSIHLDNAKFNESGVITFDSLDNMAEQEIVLDHTEIRYNLIVSVEWDAERPFLWGLEDNIRAASNYLYDITDGQARLDTVVILDAKVEWEWADVRVYASNAVGSRATPVGIRRSAGPGSIKIPRRDYGKTRDNRDSTYVHHPLDEVVIETFRVLIHELGHYALGLYDEYMYCCEPDGSYDSDPYSPLKCAEIDFYGFMHWMRVNAGEWGSEMSSSAKYTEPACLNTKQYVQLGMSCWDWFELQTEGDYELVGSVEDTVFVPIIKPDDPERDLEPGFDYIPGPNNNTGFPSGTLDYDVGRLVVFTNEVMPPEPQVTSVHVLVEHVPPGGGEVRLFRNTVDGFVIVEQGNTTDAGYLWVYGANAVMDHIDAGGRRVREVPPPGALASLSDFDIAWLYGSASVSGDSLILSLEPIDGEYPLICEMHLGASDATLSLTAQSMFSTAPSLMLSTSYGGDFDDVFTPGASQYTAAVTDSLGYDGTFTITAVDASAQAFSFWVDYTVALPDSSDMRLLGPANLSAVWFDSADTEIDRALLLTSPYPVIRTGLDADAVQAGETQSLSIYPATALGSPATLYIEYDDAALNLGDGSVGNEADLQIYNWDTSLVEWVLVGGDVDTIRNEVWSMIPGAGVYAAFTTNIITDVNDDQHGVILPYRFKLSQNYPNPFNPVTNIEYNIPTRSHVTIEIYNILGQKIRTLVDETKPAGEYQTTWNGDDSNGTKVSTGIYFYRFQAGDYIETKKMILLK